MMALGSCSQPGGSGATAMAAAAAAAVRARANCDRQPDWTILLFHFLLPRFLRRALLALRVE